MTHDNNSYCQRCGNCCKGVRWKKTFSFTKAQEICGQYANKREVEEKLISSYVSYLAKIGIPVEKVHPVEWDKKQKQIVLQFSVGRCKHLTFTENNIAICLNYNNRQKACRQYLCKKAKDKIILERIKKRESEGVWNTMNPTTDNYVKVT